MTTLQETDQKSIFLVTTADTDILTAEKAIADMAIPDFPRVVIYNPVALDSSEGRIELLENAAGAGVVVLRLLGGKRAMPDVFDPLVELCHSNGIPLIACPGHQEWDEDLVAACSAPVAEIETVFAYLMRGGVQNTQNLLLFLSDTYLETNYGHGAPEPVPWQGIYHPDIDSGIDVDSYIRLRFTPDRAAIGLLFYRAHWMSGNLNFIDELIYRLEKREINVLPVFSFSLKHVEIMFLAHRRRHFSEIFSVYENTVVYENFNI